MDLYMLLSVISGIIFTVAFIPYIKAILKMQITPAFFSWLLWAALDIVTFISMRGEGGVHLWLLMAAIAGASTVTVLSLKYGERTINATNIICTILVVVAIKLQLDDMGLLSLLTGLLGLIVAAVPTMIKAWKDPASEDKKSWIIFVVSSVTACLAVSDWKVLGDSLPPATFFLIDTTILVIILFRPKRAA